MNKKREEFFRLHPSCAFCGGRAAATEIDHIPSRQFFHLRQWPEEFEFPACASCNRRTKDAEQVVAFVARLYPDPKSETELAEFRKVCDALRNNYPDVLREMQLTPRQARKMQRATPALIARKVRPESVNALSLRGPLVRSAIKQFATKLFVALHYRESGAKSLRLPPELLGSSTRIFKGLSEITRTKSISCWPRVPESSEIAPIYRANSTTPFES